MEDRVLNALIFTLEYSTRPSSMSSSLYYIAAYIYLDTQPTCTYENIRHLLLWASGSHNITIFLEHIDIIAGVV